MSNIEQSSIERETSCDVVSPEGVDSTEIVVMEEGLPDNLSCGNTGKNTENESGAGLSIAELLSPSPDDPFLLYKGLFASALSAALGGVGNGMVPVSIPSLLQPFALLLGIDWLFIRPQYASHPIKEEESESNMLSGKIPSLCSRQSPVFLYLVAIHTVGFCLQFYTMLSYPNATPVSYNGLSM